jgi:hypothetical protein
MEAGFRVNPYPILTEVCFRIQDSNHGEVCLPKGHNECT